MSNYLSPAYRSNAEIFYAQWPRLRSGILARQIIVIFRSNYVFLRVKVRVVMTNSYNRSFKEFLAAARLNHNDTNLNPFHLTPLLDYKFSIVACPKRQSVAQLSFSIQLGKRSSSKLDTLEHLCSFNPKRLRPWIDNSKEIKPGTSLPDSTCNDSLTLRTFKFSFFTPSSESIDR